MAISQTTIMGSIKTPTNVDAKVSRVVFTLSGADFENGEIIAVGRVEAVCDIQNGDFHVTLWPNDRGLNNNTVYSVTFKLSDGSSISGIGDIYVRHSDHPVTLEDVVAETMIARDIQPYSLRVMTQAQFDSLGVSEPQTVYLIKG